MQKFYDQRYLKEQQYRRPDNLNARIALHQRFSTNRQGWQPWVFEHLGLEDRHCLVEFGCGPGDLWLENQESIPAGARLLLGDLSHGMGMEAQRRFGDDPRFAFFNADIQFAPLPGRAFDRVVANHMLYHVPDIDRGAAEMARLVKPGGRVMAATNGEHTMHELYRLIQEVAPIYNAPPAGASGRFSLQNGPAFFEKHFSRVWVERYEDALWVTEARPLVDYIFSSPILSFGLDGIARKLLEVFFQRRITRDGGIPIGKEGGVILAQP